MVSLARLVGSLDSKSSGLGPQAQIPGPFCSWSIQVGAHQPDNTEVLRSLQLPPKCHIPFGTNGEAPSGSSFSVGASLEPLWGPGALYTVPRHQHRSQPLVHIRGQQTFLICCSLTMCQELGRFLLGMIIPLLSGPLNSAGQTRDNRLWLEGPPSSCDQKQKRHKGTGVEGGDLILLNFIL